ncbi:MAG TPA: DUF4157 domain-containing protein [Longimicrobium sp.]
MHTFAQRQSPVRTADAAEPAKQAPAKRRDESRADEAGGARTLQRSAAGGGAPGEVPPAVHDVLRSPGRPLDAETRAFFEPRFGFDFSRVRIHADGPAAESARAVRARAFTVGRDVVMGRDSPPPRTPAGRRLLAHELAHAVQQESSSPRSGGGLTIAAPGDAHEREADRAEAAVDRGIPIPRLTRITSPALLARKPPQETGPASVEAGEPTAAERRELVELAARQLAGTAERVELRRTQAAEARDKANGPAPGARAFHEKLNMEWLGPLLLSVIATFESQRSELPGINFPDEAPEQTKLGDGYAKAMDQIGQALEEIRINAAGLAPADQKQEEAAWARSHMRWLAANPAAPLGAGIRETFTQSELDLSAKHNQEVTKQAANLVANLHLYDLSGKGAQRLRDALYDSTYRLEKDATTPVVHVRPDTALMATIQPVLDQLDAIQWALDQAVDRLTRAEKKTRAFAADPVANKTDGDTLQAHFRTRDAGYATLLADRLARLARELGGQGSLTVHARDPNDPQCGVGSVGSGFSRTVAHADANEFHFCTGVTVGDDEIVSTVIHETVHAVIPQLGAKSAVKTSADTPGDRAYSFERVYWRLSTEEALDNAESYAFYVDALLGVAVTRPDAPTDEIKGCTDEETVKDAIARATYRIRLGAMWADQSFATPVPSGIVDIVRFAFPQADATKAGEILTHMMNLAARLEYYLPVVCTKATDAEAKAGALTYGAKLRATATGVAATSKTYPAGTIRICPEWFKAGDAVREDTLTAILALRYRDTVPQADLMGIVTLARHIQEEVHPSVATRTLQQHQAADAPPP